MRNYSLEGGKYIGLRKCRIILIALLGALLAISLFNQTHFSFASLDFQVSLRFLSQGKTEIMFPPLGTVSASTHMFPAKISLILKNINFEILQELIAQGIEQQRLFTDMQLKLNHLLKIYALKTICLGVVGSILAAIIFRPNDIKVCLKSGIIGLCFSSLMVGSIYYTYDIKQFYNPKYYGALENAPWMIEMLQESLAKIEQLGQRIQTTAQNVDTLFQQLEHTDMVKRSTSETIKILHVSDIHNNPIAFQFMEQMIESFDVDIIVDTGDITDFGTPLESMLLDKIESLGVPYLFVAGNHDSPQVISTLENINSVININGSLINVKGIIFAGINDPASISNNVVLPLQEKMNEYMMQINDMLYASETVPDVLLVHNPWLGKMFAGRVRTILHGHNHQYGIETIKGSLLINAGTTGAAGIRGLGESNEVPYSLAVLHFENQQADTSGLNWRLIATDTIQVYNSKPGFTVEHHVFPD